MEQQAHAPSSFPSLQDLSHALPESPENELSSNTALPQTVEQEPDDNDSCLFVGDIARTLTEDQMKEIFSPYGEVVTVEIKRDRITKASLGYAFVQYKIRHDAASAKKALHKTVIANRAIRIGWAQKNTNLFVGDLDSSVTSEMLRDGFRVFGELIEDETFAKKHNYGFVKFKRRIDAETAKREMDGRLLGGRRIRTGWGDANTQRHCVHIQFDPTPHSASTPTASPILSETDLFSAFSRFGVVVNVHLPRTSSRLRGFGFVRFYDTDEGEEAAEAAITALHNTYVAGVLVSCNFGKKQATKRKSGNVATLPPLPLDLATKHNIEDSSDSQESPKYQLSHENAPTGSVSASENGNNLHNGKDDTVNMHKRTVYESPKPPKGKQKPRHKQHQPFSPAMHSRRRNSQHSQSQPHPHAHANANANAHAQAMQTQHDVQHSIPQQQMMPTMYPPWIPTQGWLPYIPPQYYHQGIHTMQDTVDMTNTTHYQHTMPPSDEMSPVYMYSYSNPHPHSFHPHSSYAYSYAAHGT